MCTHERTTAMYGCTIVHLRVCARMHARNARTHTCNTRRWQLVARLNSDVERLESTLMSERAAMQRIQEEFERGSSLLAEACVYVSTRTRAHTSPCGRG